MAILGGNLWNAWANQWQEGMARLDLSSKPVLSLSFALISPYFIFFSSNLGFRVHVVVFRSWRNVPISSGLMIILTGFSLRATLIRAGPQPGSSIWAGCRRWRIWGARTKGRAESCRWWGVRAILNCTWSLNWPRNWRRSRKIKCRWSIYRNKQISWQGGFYCCVIALFLFYLLFICH